LALPAALERRYADAAMLAGYADACNKSSTREGNEHVAIDRARTLAREALGDEYDRLHEEGASLCTEQIAAIAFAEAPAN
jgi:hypothetical protein